MSEHLILPFYEQRLERRKRGGGKIEKRTNKDEFGRIQVYKLGNLKKEHEEKKKKFSQYFDPNLIFKIKLSQRVPEKDFTDFLERRGIKVISPSPDGVGYWITIAVDESLENIKQSIEKYMREEKQYNFLDAIEELFEPIPPEEKIGEQLKEIPLEDDEIAYLDVEIWRMEDSVLRRFLEGDGNKIGFKRWVENKGGFVTDELITKTMCLLRIKMNKSILQEILELKEVCRVDRPPRPKIRYKMLSVDLEDLDIKGSPPENATAIAVIDSGVLSNHPLLKNAIGDEIAVSLLSSDRIKKDKPQDDVGHGTKVAGIALYGDIKKCINERTFKPEIWILSAKVMYKNDMGEAEYNPEELLEHQLERAIRYFVKKYPNCKIINLSLGDTYKKMFGNKRQFSLATLIDELARELDVIFVISTGNLFLYTFERNYYLDNYPSYLIEEREDVKIIDPAPAAYAITVGAVSPDVTGAYEQTKIVLSPVKKDYPSPFTRVGPGYKKMIKPELIEEGGSLIFRSSISDSSNDLEGKLIVLNPQWIEEGRLFTIDYGTSFSAPKVSYFLAKLFNQFPKKSPNLIKALLLSSAEIPSDRPELLQEIDFSSSDTQLMDLLKIYGYGKPNLKIASMSNNNDVLLVAENVIKPDDIHLYYFYLPENFITTQGKREISVTLTYNPPVNRNRIDYLGIGMEFHLFRNSEIDEVIKEYKNIIGEYFEEDVVPEELKLKEIVLKPGVRTRSRGLHQKGIKIYTRKPQIETNKPLVLAVISKNKWVNNDEYLQDYAIVVRIKHSARIDIYNRVKERIEIKERVRIR